MILYCNGCSNTRGTHWSLKNHDRSLTWPNRLAKKLEATLIDDSKEGCSNFRILKTSVESILKMENKPDLVVIQWTYNERFISPLGINETNPAEPKGFRTHNPYAVSMGANPTPYENFYKNFYNRKSKTQRAFLEEQTYFYIYMMQTFLEQKNLDYVFMTFETKEKTSTRQANRYKNKYINSSKFMHDIDVSIEEILDSFNYKRSGVEKPNGKIDNHYKEDAHEFISECILDFNIVGQKLYSKSQHKLKRANSIIHFYDEDL